MDKKTIVGKVGLGLASLELIKLGYEVNPSFAEIRNSIIAKKFLKEFRIKVRTKSEKDPVRLDNIPADFKFIIICYDLESKHKFSIIKIDDEFKKKYPVKENKEKWIEFKDYRKFTERWDLLK